MSVSHTLCKAFPFYHTVAHLKSLIASCLDCLLPITSQIIRFRIASDAVLGSAHSGAWTGRARCDKCANGNVCKKNREREERKNKVFKFLLDNKAAKFYWF